MKRLLIVALVTTAASVSVSASVKPLPWTHQGKKTPPVSSNRIEYHGRAGYSAEGRLYFPSSGGQSAAPPSQSKPRSAKVK